MVKQNKIRDYYNNPEGCYTRIKRELLYVNHINAILWYRYVVPSKGDALIVQSGCNTAESELHLRPAVAKSPSTLDAFSGSAHPIPLAKVNASPPANFHHPSYDCLRLSPMHFQDLFFIDL